MRRCSVCGSEMRVTGCGSRYVEGESEPVHTLTYSCVNGHTDFAPKLAADK